MQQKNEQFFEGVRKRIRTALEQSELSKIELSRKAHIGYTTVFNILNGKARLRNDIVAKIAPALGVSAEFLLTGEDTGKPVAVRESDPEWNVKSGAKITLARAFKKIADELEMPEKEVRRCFARCVEDWSGDKGKAAVSDRSASA